MTFLECKHCGRIAEGGTRDDARRNWNKMIRTIVNDTVGGEQHE